MNAIAALASSGDGRLARLDSEIRLRLGQHDALIEVLHVAQRLFGCLDRDLLSFVARTLKLPPSRVYGVATFYHLFHLAPRGRHQCVVCEGTACYIRGSSGLIAETQKASGVSVGATSADGRISLLSARCIGACGIAPVVVYDGVMTGRQSAESVRDHLHEWAAYAAD